MNNDNVEAVGQAGASNLMIWKQIKQRNYDLAIVNVTSLYRLRDQELARYKKTVDLFQRLEANTPVVRHIIAQPNTHVWSSYPEYEYWDTVDWRPMASHNEYYNKSVPLTGNHLTYKGNVMMIAWAKQLILDKLGVMVK